MPSVRPCWSLILLKLQNSIMGVFQCIFHKISEHVFYRTAMNWYFRTKKARCKYWSSIALFESGITSEETKVQIFKFLLKVFVRYHFGRLCLKKAFDLEKVTNIQLLSKEKENNFFGKTQRCSAKMLPWEVTTLRFSPVIW